jgi:CDP-diacylglycerol--serine O-phosphatidyltransferase
MLLIAFLMMSPVRYPSGKKVDLQTETKLRRLAGVVVFAGFIYMFKEVAFVCTCLGYIFFGLFRHWRRRRLARLAPGNFPQPTSSL